MISSTQEAVDNIRQEIRQELLNWLTHQFSKQILAVTSIAAILKEVPDGEAFWIVYLRGVPAGTLRTPKANELIVPTAQAVIGVVALVAYITGSPFILTVRNRTTIIYTRWDEMDVYGLSRSKAKTIATKSIPASLP